MADLLVRNVDEQTKHRLAIRAAKNGRSMQAEARKIIEEAVNPDARSWVRVLMAASQDAQEDGFEPPERHTVREMLFE